MHGGIQVFVQHTGDKDGSVMKKGERYEDAPAEVAEAIERGVPYQTMIRRVLDLYTDRFQHR